MTGTVVNFRKEPNLSSKVLLKLEKGTKVTVIDSKGDWYNVVYNDAYGWMHQDWVQVRDKSIAVGIVTGTVVNVRSKPDINSEVITKFNKGTKVEIYEKSGKWYRVAIGEERHGWMHSDWVAIKEESVSRGSAQPERPDDDSKAAGTSDAGDKQDGAVSGDKGGTAICRMELIRRRPVMLRQKKRDLRMALVKRMLLTVQPVMTQQMKRQTMKPVKTQEMKQQTMKQARMRRKISQTGRRS